MRRRAARGLCELRRRARVSRPSVASRGLRIARGMETLESSRVCRLCGQHSGISINIFDESENHVRKINAVLPIMVRHYTHSLSLSLSRSNGSFLPSRSPPPLHFFPALPFRDSLLHSGGYAPACLTRVQHSSSLHNSGTQTLKRTLLPLPLPDHLVMKRRVRSLY